ncbi:MAG: TonB-dependent receptor [Gammaproteobacteria bacterium]|nr:TonB-dependent receptor [Gammaproteobacteria bacterium]
MSMKNKPQHAIWALLAAAALAGTAFAQEADESEDESADDGIETVIVTGIRGSMQQSLERKRQADHFVDAITAEDIGAFPEQNLAEALQRISGVAIDRKSGEGKFVSVRGLGPQFVQTTIGGRVAASNNAPGSHDGRGQTNPKSRVVGFDSFQAGLVQAVEVHKSPRADHVEGGLGGFVDIQARKPLNLGERHIAFAVDSTVNELADDTAPGVFALFSDVLSETMGFMVSAQWDNRVFRSDSVHHNGYINNPLPVVINGVEIGTGYYPKQIHGELHITDRDRLNISSALQFRPSDRVDVTLDMLYTKNEASEIDYWQSFRLSQGHPRITAATLTDDNGTGIFTMVSTSGAGAFMQHATEEVDNVAVNYGANLQFQATDRLSLNLDVAVSDTEAPIMNRDALMRNTRAQMTYRRGEAGAIPSLTSSSPLNDPNFYSVVKQSVQEHIVDDSNIQFRVDATYELDGDWLDTVQVGFRSYSQERRDRSRYLNSRAFINDPISEFGGGLEFPANSDFLDAIGVHFPNPVLSPPFHALQETFTTRADEIEAGGGFNTGTGKSLAEYTSGRFNEDVDHEDDSRAVYAMVTFSGELGDIPYSGNFGVRYVDNDTSSEGQVAQPYSIDFSDPTAPEILIGAPEFISQGHAYEHVLPSFNVRLDPRDDLVIRLSVAKVMSRPDFGRTRPNLSVQARNRTMRGGNAELDPTTGVQFDLAVEWYFADYSIFSVGLFTKEMEGFIQDDFEIVPFPNIIDPITNAPLVLEHFTPLNTADSSLVGLELSFQRTMEGLLPAPFDGLGVIANYTMINSGSDFVSQKTNASYSVPGLSDNTVNFTVFYEKGPWAGRVSYNFRDEFLDNIGVAWQPHPTFVEPYSQLDAAFSYALTDKLKVAVEAINLTDENVYYYHRLGTGNQDHFAGAINAGRRFQFGARYQF